MLLFSSFSGTEIIVETRVDGRHQRVDFLILILSLGGVHKILRTQFCIKEIQNPFNVSFVKTMCCDYKHIFSSVNDPASD